MVEMNSLKDFWTKRGGGQIFDNTDMGGLTVIYGICTC